MTTEGTRSPNTTRLETTYDAPAELIWELCTTAAGLEEWCGPDGFETRVSELELLPGCRVQYTMTATRPEQVAFVRNLGMPLSSEFRRTFTEVEPPSRLAYLSLIDFVPDHEPYEHLTVIDIEPADDCTNVVMTLDPSTTKTGHRSTATTVATNSRTSRRRSGDAQSDRTYPSRRARCSLSVRSADFASRGPWAGASPASTVPIGRHSGSKRSVLLAGNARAAERLIRASETLGSDETQKA